MRLRLGASVPSLLRLALRARADFSCGALNGSPPTEIRSQMAVEGDIEKGGMDRVVRQRWLGNCAYVREAKARAERNVVRFGPDGVDGSIDSVIGMLASSADREEPIHFADPCLMNRLKGQRGARLYLDMFASTSDRSLRMLCGERLRVWRCV